MGAQINLGQMSGIALLLFSSWLALICKWTAENNNNTSAQLYFLDFFYKKSPTQPVVTAAAVGIIPIHAGM